MCSVLDIFVDYTVIPKPPIRATDGSSESGQSDNASIDIAREAPRPSSDNTDSGDPLTASGDFRPL